MFDYIQRGAVLELLERYDADRAAREIEKLSAADVRPERHGEWFGTVCTACGESTSDYFNCDYCPRCGAIMDGAR